MPVKLSYPMATLTTAAVSHRNSTACSPLSLYSDMYYHRRRRRRRSLQKQHREYIDPGFTQVFSTLRSLTHSLACRSIFATSTQSAWNTIDYDLARLGIQNWLYSVNTVAAHVPPV